MQRMERVKTRILRFRTEKAYNDTVRKAITIKVLHNANQNSTIQIILVKTINASFTSWIRTLRITLM